MPAIEGAQNAEAQEPFAPRMFMVGDLNVLFKEADEEIDAEIIQQHQRAHDAFLREERRRMRRR